MSESKDENIPSTIRSELTDEDIPSTSISESTDENIQSNSMSESIDENIPSAEECQKLIDSFVKLTKTDEALAQFYLQDKWELEVALDSYYAGEASKSNTAGGASKNDIANESDDLIVTFDSGEVVRATTRPPQMLKFLTWNIDGLDDIHLKKRVKAVLKCILRGDYDIVHLQEVTDEVYNYIQANLPEYLVLTAGSGDYFVATLLKKTTVVMDGMILHNFQNSVMGRHMLEVEARMGNMRIHALNTHLESTAQFSNERKAQLREAFSQMVRSQQHDITILAGDLNLRDKELLEMRIPNGVVDLWVESGCRKECQYTWDLTRNTNKSVPGKFQPKCRFDRMYMYQSNRSANLVHFGLEGIEKVEGIQKFPSDHWGLQAHFQSLSNSPTSCEPPTRSAMVPSEPLAGRGRDRDVIVLE